MKNKDIKQSIFAYAIAGILGFGLLLIAYHTGNTESTEQIQQLLAILGLESFGIVGLGIYTLYSWVSGIGTAVIYSYVSSWCAVHLFGVKASWKRLFYVLMLVFGGITIINGLFGLLGIFGKGITMALAFMVSIYSFYLIYLATKGTYSLDRAKTIACIILAYLTLITGYILLAMIFAEFWA